MAGLLLILVIVNAGITGWLFAKVRSLLRQDKRASRYVVVDADSVPTDE